MNKQRLLLGLSCLTLAGMASQAGGCLSSSANNNSDGGSGGNATNSSSGSSSSGGSSSGSSSSGSGSGGSGGDGSNCSAADPTSIIDDMSGSAGTANATGGYWYTYSDRTVPNSEPPILLSSDGGGPPGSITPPEGQTFPISDAGTVNGCTWGYREVVGGGEAVWGAGFGMDFKSTPPDGGQVAFNTCDAGQIFNVNDDSGLVGIVQPFDASKWKGIQFWAISFTGKSQAVFIHMDDKDTSPWGGFCNACNSAGGQVKPCSDSFSKSVTFTANWTLIQIPFTDPLFKPENWSMNGIMAPIDAKTLYNLHFQITKHPAPQFDLGVAMVQFY